LAGRSLEAVRLAQLMQESTGDPSVLIALIDGPVNTALPQFSGSRVRSLPGIHGTCSYTDGGVDCFHGTCVASILISERRSGVPGICPDCTLVVRPITSRVQRSPADLVPTPIELAQAITECVDAGAAIINLSLTVQSPNRASEKALTVALDYAASRSVLVVIAAGNGGTISSTSATRHPWVIPVVACDEFGVPLAHSNMSGAIGRNGVCVPSQTVPCFGSDGSMAALGGGSAAVPLVVGTLGLLRSIFPDYSSGTLRHALRQAAISAHRSIVPPLFNAWSLYQIVRRSIGDFPRRRSSELGE
jgi:subtilisin family serine protease